MRGRQSNSWTAEEVDTIRRLYPTNGAAGVAVVLTHRTEAAISLRASMNGIRIARNAGPRDVTKGTRERAGKPLEPIPDRRAAGLPEPPAPVIVRAADIRPGMILNRYPIGTSAKPALRKITQAKLSTAGSRTFFMLAWLPAARASGKLEVPMAQWDFARHPDLAFEVYTSPDALARGGAR